MRSAKAAVAAAGAAGVVTAWTARYLAPTSPVLEQIAVDGGRSMAGVRPLRAGFVTDTHIGPVIRAADVDRAMALLAAVEPDILLFGGDFVCESPRYIPEVAAVLEPFASAAKFGAYAVLGNHDYSNDAPRLTSALERSGVHVLRNEAVAVGKEDFQLWLAGIDDALLGNPDPAEAFAAVPVGTAPLALWHEPDWADQSAAQGAFLQLSGHSHGGQVVLPGLGAAAAPAGGKRYISGLNVACQMPVYTSRGVGAYRPPLRFRCSPEVTLIELF